MTTEKEIRIHLYIDNHSFNSKRMITKKSHLKRMLEDIYKKAKDEIK